MRPRWKRWNPGETQVTPPNPAQPTCPIRNFRTIPVGIPYPGAPALHKVFADDFALLVRGQVRLVVVTPAVPAPVLWGNHKKSRNFGVKCGGNGKFLVTEGVWGVLSQKSWEIWGEKPGKKLLKSRKIKILGRKRGFGVF